MSYLKALVAKIIAKIKAEPAVATGGVFGVALVIEQWVQVNHITNLREAVTLAGPIVLAFIIRTFVTPTNVVAARTDGKKVR